MIGTELMFCMADRTPMAISASVKSDPSMGVEYVRRAADPVLSVVIPSVPLNDHRSTVACFEGQTIGVPFEVILVNDGGLDRSEARNRGLEAASANVVALTDDDTRPPPDWLEIAHGEFNADPELVCLEGPVFGGARSFRPRHYVGCNLAVRREAALAVGGFRSDFSEWREDTEFGWRMERDADGVCRFDESFRMCHPTVPRTALNLELEKQLRAEYPDRYDDVLDDAIWRGPYRRARAAGITQPLQRLRNEIRFAFSDPCEVPKRFE